MCVTNWHYIFCSFSDAGTFQLLGMNEDKNGIEIIPTLTVMGLHGKETVSGTACVSEWVNGMVQGQRDNQGL